MLAYARHLLAGGRWTDLAEFFDDRQEGGNSHMPMLNTYRRMLDIFQPIRERMIRDLQRGIDGFALSEAELTEIVHAWYHPDRRARGY